MRSPAEILGDHLSGPSSRRGFLATLGKLALLGGSALAALGGKDVYAAWGAYGCVYKNHNYGDMCPNGGYGTYAGCCVSGGKYYTTYCCTLCCYSFATSPGCPQRSRPLTYLSLGQRHGTGCGGEGTPP